MRLGVGILNFISIFVHSKEARMAELVDALVSNTNRFTPVPVRSRLRVREEKFKRTSLFLWFLERIVWL